MNDVIFFSIVDQMTGSVNDIDTQLSTYQNILTNYTNRSLTELTTATYQPGNSDQENTLQLIIQEFQQIFSLQQQSLAFIETEINTIVQLFQMVQDYIVIHGDTVVPKDIIETYNYILNYRQYQLSISNIQTKLTQKIGTEFLFTPYDTCAPLRPLNFPIVQSDGITIRQTFLYRPKIINPSNRFEEIHTILTKKPECFQQKQVTYTHYYFTKDTIDSVFSILNNIQLTLSKIKQLNRKIEQQIIYL